MDDSLRLRIALEGVGHGPAPEADARTRVTSRRLTRRMDAQALAIAEDVIGVTDLFSRISDWRCSAH